MDNRKSKDTKRIVPKKGKTKAKTHTTHGGYAQVTKYRGQKLDMRRRDDRALRAWQNSVIKDCGGLPEMDTYQLSMLDRATEAMIILRAMGFFVERKVIVMKGGELVPCLRNSYVAYSNVFRLALESIYSRLGKKPSKVKTIPEILKKYDK